MHFLYTGVWSPVYCIAVCRRSYLCPLGRRTSHFLPARRTMAQGHRRVLLKAPTKQASGRFGLVQPSASIQNPYYEGRKYQALSREQYLKSPRSAAGSRPHGKCRFTKSRTATRNAGNMRRERDPKGYMVYGIAGKYGNHASRGIPRENQIPRGKLHNAVEYTRYIYSCFHSAVLYSFREAYFSGQATSAGSVVK